MKKERTSRSEQLQARNEASHSKLDSLSVFKCVPSMHRGRVFIGDGSPTTLRYYTVMPPNNYIPGVQPYFYIIWLITSEPLLPIGPITANWAHYKILCAAFEARTLRRLPFRSSSLQSAPWSSPLFASLRLRLWRTGLRRRRLGLRHSSLLFVFACGELVFAVGASVFARSLKPFDCSACRAGRRPCCIQIAHGPSTSFPEAPPFGPRPIASRSVEA